MRDLDDRIAGLHTATRPPSAETTAAARSALISEMGSTAKPRRGRLKNVRPRAARWRVSLIAGATAAALVAGGWGFWSWHTRPLYSPEPLAGYSGPAATFLLAAADARARNAGDGQLWYRRAAVGGTVMAKSPYRAGVTYPMEVERDDFLLASTRKPFTADGSSHPTRHLEWPGDRLRVRPATPAARTEWKTDLRPEAEDLHIDSPGASVGPEMGGGPVLDFSDDTARRLPTDPAELRAWLLNYATRFDHKRLPDPELYLFRSASFLLVDAPVSDKVRIATYRLLASLKNVRAVTTTDAMGRSGQGVSMREVSEESGTLDIQLIIDPRNGRLIASQQIIATPGRLNAGLPSGVRWYYEVIRNADWTTTPVAELLPKSSSPIETGVEESPVE
ncbi:hypothetical protein AGRA3207_002526 [Actinomadura graeca]|uniref:CU044_5270 family protein n=1 Tax=Actinomadura graeca TaxID=2750812 RepID=A0ABX8QS53_9ACTN|nr:hypothetical protein [Actinomadura graeca]QXJ21651.1 hypothetical protein AGRA3207_002526 [Actinomadura graeca]